MRRWNVAVAAAFLAAMIVSTTGCEKLRARDSLNKGVQSFKAGKYSEAVEFFKTACDLDPEFTTARLYLATAYNQQYIPGAESPDNVKFAQSAMDQFQKVLEKEPGNVLATQSIANLFYQQKKFDQAEEWNRKVISLDPKNKEAYYTLGVLAWTQWLPVDRQARIDSNQKPEDPGPIKNEKIREELKAKWMPVLDKGVDATKKALEIDPEYEDAMAYMNLLIRYRADLLDSTGDWKKASEEADNWMTKSLETKKTKAERKAAAATGGSAPKTE